MFYNGGNIKSADNKELNYQFKTNINMKTKTSILALTKAFFILLVICCFLVGFTTITDYITVHGEKYYKCKTRYETDTIESPDATIIIVKKQIILYDHFKCDGLK